MFKNIKNPVAFGNEKFYPIKEFEGYYVSKNGEIYSTKTNRKLKIKICNTHGYCSVNLSEGSSRTTKKIHRLVAETFILNPLDKPAVNHKNGIKTDNRIENLEWVTFEENNKHYHTDPNMKEIKKAALKKMSESSKKLTGEKNGMFGKKHSEETKKKISSKAIGRKSHTCKVVINTITGETLESAEAYRKKYNLPKNRFYRCVQGKVDEVGGHYVKYK